MVKRLPGQHVAQQRKDCPVDFHLKGPATLLVARRASALGLLHTYLTRLDLCS